jgi:hypothetical protein
MVPTFDPVPAPGQNIEIAELNGYVASIWMALPTAFPGDEGQTVLFARHVLAKQEMAPLCEVNVSRS